ncbi:hypothetical protein HDV03_003591 [Kappamyces sp. JEL0829]|nr:hypothetical protein HDV03_003591 [Kappamyces sp. JEL0829]
MSIQSIVQQSCQALALAPPEAYALQLKKQLLEPSLSVRLAGLSNGARLNLIYRGVSSAVQFVNIALQTEDAGRLVDQFATSASLWQILVHFEGKAGGQHTFTRKEGLPSKKGLFPSGQSVYLVPVVVFMNKEYGSIEALRTTTLQSLGILSGNASFRLLFQFTEHPLAHFAAEIDAIKDTSQDNLAKPSAVPAPSSSQPPVKPSPAPSVAPPPQTVASQPQPEHANDEVGIAPAHL